MPKVLLAVLFAARARALAPFSLRVDLHLGDGPFITLDAPTGVGPNISFSWALPAGIPAQSAARVRVTTPAAGGGNTTVYDSGFFASPATPWLAAGAAQAAALARAALAPATAYDWSVAVRDGAGAASEWSAPQRFFTSAGARAWAATEPVWAPACGGGAPPAFAYFRGALPLTGGGALLSALLYVTGSPPIYSDPWNVTKIAGGFTLSVNGTRRGTGPGKAACGPVAMSACTPTQPYDGFDVSADVRAAAAAGAPLAVDLVAYALAQPAHGLVPAAQAVLVARWADGTVETVGTAAGAGAWAALDATGVVNPGANKAPFWYTQPREDADLRCLPAPGGAPPPAACARTCGWGAPARVAGAFAGAALAGKATQATHLEPARAPAAATQLGPGWWLLDAGFEIQGGVNAALARAAAPAGGARLLVQLGEELAANGSARWQMRAGNKYQDAWTLAGAGARDEQRAYSHHEFSEFRYAELILTDAATGAPLDVPLGAAGLDASFWRVHYPYDDAAATAITTSDADVNAVWDFAASTLKTTTLDMYSDSSTRQRSFDCMADDTTAALAHYASTAELAFPRFAAAQIWATMDGGYVSPNWADWTILPALNLVNDALYSGDASFAAPLFDDLAARHTYAALIDAATGLVHNGGGLSALIDTSGGSDDGFVQSGVNSVVNAWVYLALRSAAWLARWLDRAADAGKLDAQAAALAAAFQVAMYNGAGAICDGPCAATPHAAAHATFYALYSGILDGAPYQADLVATLAGRTANDSLGMPCGSYPAQFLVGGLYKAGADHGRAAHAALTSRAPHSWLNMLAQFGATATMECWLPEELENLSFSHIWSASPAITIPQGLFGVSPTAPGWARARVAPQPGPVREGSLRMTTVRGPLGVRFAQGGEAPGAPGACLAVSVDVPGGVAVDVALPRWGAAGVVVRVDGAAAAAATDGDYAVVTVGPGAHTATTC
jgi:alpha-L-rhamnosidase